MAVRKKMEVAIGAHDERMMNISTALVNMGTEYIGTIGVGTAPDGSALFEAKVVFDTGSTNLWVASSLCTEAPCDSTKHFYDPEKSASHEEFLGMSNGHSMKGRELHITFGTGELKGPLHVDTFHVGPLGVKKQPFGAIRKMTGYVFSSFPFEGILGLGFPSLSFGGITPFFDHVIEQKLLKHNEFAFFLNMDSSKPSALLWGGIDKSLYHGKIRMFPVVQAHYWALDLVDFKVGNKSMKSAGMDGDSVKRLIVDTGTTYYTAPQGLHDELMPEIRAQNHPPITFVLKGTDGDNYELVVNKDSYSDGGSPAFMALDVNKKYGPAMLLGEVFMKHFFVVYHRGDGKDKSAKIGIAPANTDAQPKVKPFREQQSVLESGKVKLGRRHHQSVTLDEKASTTQGQRLYRRETHKHHHK